MTAKANRPERLKGTPLRPPNPATVVEQTILAAGVADAGGFGSIDYSALSPEFCTIWLPQLKAAIASLTTMAEALERQAEGIPPTACAECGSRFYPSRSDARFCGSACRMRAHRRKNGGRL